MKMSLQLNVSVSNWSDLRAELGPDSRIQLLLMIQAPLKLLSVSASPIVIRLFVTCFKQDWDLSSAELFENKIYSSICTFAMLLKPKHWIHLDEKVFFVSRVMECGKSEMIWKLFFSVNNIVGKPYFPIQHFRGTISHVAEIKVRLYKPCHKSDMHFHGRGFFSGSQGVTSCSSFSCVGEASLGEVLVVTLEIVQKFLFLKCIYH